MKPRLIDLISSGQLPREIHMAIDRFDIEDIPSDRIGLDKVRILFADIELSEFFFILVAQR